MVPDRMNALPVAPALAPPVPVGCQSEDDCPEYNSCRNRACVDPCAEDDPCSAAANCQVVRHNVVCTCPDGYVGDPKTSCIRREYPLRQPCNFLQGCLVPKFSKCH